MDHFVSHRDAIRPYLTELHAVLDAMPHREIDTAVIVG